MIRPDSGCMLTVMAINSCKQNTARSDLACLLGSYLLQFSFGICSPVLLQRSDSVASEIQSVKSFRDKGTISLPETFCVLK